MPEISILSNKNIIMCNAKIYSETFEAKEIFCDILLIMPDFKINNMKITTKIAIIYGDAPFSNLHSISFKKIITYGMSSKNTATISSMCQNDLLLAIQREITNINGNIIQIGEYKSENITENQLETLGLTLLSMINSS
ncbi:MAG: hypothetical protein R3Y12_08750 [Clostridia bacterium]